MSPVLRIGGRPVFQADTRGKPAGVFLLPFAKQLFQVWTLSECERNVSGSDVPRRLNESSTAFCRAFISTPCRALYFRPLIFRGLLCEPEAKSHLLAKCGQKFKACLLGKIEVCRFEIVQAERRIWFFP